MSKNLYLYAKKQSIENGEVEYLDLDTDELFSFTQDRDEASLVSQEYVDSYFLHFNKDILTLWNLTKIKPNQIDLIPKVSVLNQWSPGGIIANMINQQSEMGYNYIQFKNNDNQKGMHNFLEQNKKHFEDKGYTVLLNIDYNSLSKQDVVIW